MNNRETAVVVFGPDTTVEIPLADAIAEYFRLEGKTDRTENENRIFAALTMTLGTLSTTDGAQRLHDALQTTGH